MFEFLKKWSPFGPNWAEESEPQEFTSAQLIVMRPLDQKKFRFTRNFLIEHVQNSDRSSPQFREDFFKASRAIKKMKHPAILRMVEFGDKKNVLYRVWKRRGIYPACLSCVETPESLAMFIDGLQHLNRLGFSYEHFAADCYSFDTAGPFVLKIPYTFSGSYAYNEDHMVFRSPHSLYYAHPDGDEVSWQQSWLFYMGSIFCTMLKQGFPFDGIPKLLARDGKPVRKIPMAIEGQVGEVLDRFLAVNSEAPYSNIDEGLDDLKKALRLSPEIRYKPGVLNTWEEVSHSIILGDELKTHHIEYSPGFSSN